MREKSMAKRSPHMMRVTGGMYRGRRVRCPPGVIRPTMDRMRESLFAIMGDLTGRSFLDLFSGSGIVGIEAASRGAEPVILIERDRWKKAVILENIGFVGSVINLRIQPVRQFIRRNREGYDIIFADPPYVMKDKRGLLREIEESGTLKSDGLLIIHLPRQEIPESRIGTYHLSDRRIYGGSTLAFYRIGQPDPPEA